MAEPGGLPSMGSHRVGHDRSDLAAAAAAFLMVQLSYLYLTALKTITLTIQMSLLFNMLAMFVTVPSPPLPQEQASFNLMASVTVHSDFGAQESKI